MENKGYIRSNIKLIIFTVLTTIFALIALVFILYYIDEGHEYSDVEEAQAVEEVQEQTVPIIDEDNVLSSSAKSFIAEQIVPLANKHFDVESVEFYAHAFSEENIVMSFSIYVSNESLGRVLSEYRSATFDDEETKRLKIDMHRNITRIAELLSFKLDNDVTVQLTTEDMSNTLFIKSSQYGVKSDVFDLTSSY